MSSSVANQAGPGPGPRRERVLFCFSAAAAIVAAFFWLEGRTGFTLTDEGWLWCGTVAAIHGRVPIRDFQGYDPGRYYWGAWWATALGPGLMALRRSSAVFQALGLGFGLLALTRVFRSRRALTAAGVLLAAWMLPRAKLFDCGVGMAGIWFGVRLLERPSRGRHFLAGAFAGFAAVIGRNHGLFYGLGLLGLIILAYAKGGRRGLAGRIGAYAVGIALGWSPQLLLFAAAPGYFHAYGVELLHDLTFPRGPLPLAWPWTLSGPLLRMDALPRLADSLAPLVMPVTYLAVIAHALRSPETEVKRSGTSIACALIGLFYLRNAFYRADFPHLAQSMSPFLILALALPLLLRSIGAGKKAALQIAIGVVLLMPALPAHPLWQRLFKPDDFVLREIGNDQILVSRSTAGAMDKIFQAAREHLRPGEPVLIAPFLPGMYPVLGLESPVWETFFAIPVSEERQHQAIADLEKKHVEWVILSPASLDGIKERSMRYSHPLLWNYLVKNYCPVPDVDLPGEYGLRKKCR